MANVNNDMYCQTCTETLRDCICCDDCHMRYGDCVCTPESDAD